MRGKAGLEGRLELRKGLKTQIATHRLEITQTVHNTALEAGIEGLGVARETIATTPSSLSSQPKNNRIWTGQMYELLNSDVRVAGQRTIIRVGWFPKKKAYFLVQEYGGKAFGKDVTPMHALTNAKSVMDRMLAQKGIR